MLRHTSFGRRIAQARAHRRATVLVTAVAATFGCGADSRVDDAQVDGGTDAPAPTAVVDQIAGDSVDAPLSSSFTVDEPTGEVSPVQPPFTAERPTGEASTAAPSAAPVQQTMYAIDESAGGPLARVVGGAFADGELVLAEASTGQLHFYDLETGAPLRTVGRRGGGPGEFRRLEWLQRRGDQLYTYDSELRRLSVFSLDGTFLRTLTLQGDSAAATPEPVAVFSDGLILGARVLPEEGVSVDGVMLPRVPSVMAVRFLLSRHAPDGVQIAPLMPYRGRESFVAPNDGGGATSGPALFGRHGAAVVADSTIVVLSSDADSIVQYARDGTRLRMLSPPPTRAVAVRPSDVSRARALVVPKGAAPFNIGAVFDLQTPPERFPAFGWGGVRRVPPLAAASDGSIWLLRYGGVRSSETVYLRFSNAGQFTDSLRTPDEAMLLDARGDLVLLGTLDADGADRVLLVRRGRVVN